MTLRGISRLAATLAALTLSLSACGGDAESDERRASSTSTSPSPSDTAEVVAESTPEQVASVIAGRESDWREVIDEAGECRFSWTIGEGDPIEEANGFACYLRETTIGYTAQTAIDELAELVVPDSMTALVSETDAALHSLIDIDLEAACGEATKGPKDTKGCSRALGERMWAYSALEDSLDKWGPYL